MASVMGAAFWPPSQAQHEPPPAASNSTSFNFDDSGVGADANGNSPHYAPLQPAFNAAPPPMQSPNEASGFGFHGDAQKADRMPVCASCQQPITDRFILRVQPNLEFHVACLKCTDCHRPLDETCTAFVRNGLTYCKEDYLKLFVPTKCTRCHRPFERSERFMKARNSAFHPDCFRCSGCTRRLSIGEQFVMRENELFCRTDCGQVPPKEEPEASAGWDSFAPPNNNAESQLTPLSMKTEADEPMAGGMLQMGGGAYGSLGALGQARSLSSNSSVSSTSNGISGTGGGSSKKKRDKPTQRVRTVLTEGQLKILKHMYTQNQRPDASTKEKLVEQTGLNQRVIRVWFQNKRCKDKKRQNAIREEQQHQEKQQTLHGVRMNGTGPLTALSPTSLQDSGFLNPVDIRQFPQSPSVWSANPVGANAAGGPALGDLAYANGQPMMMNNVPVSYHELGGPQVEMPPEYAMSLNRFGMPTVAYSPSAQLPVGLPNSSLSSSPACSD